MIPHHAGRSDKQSRPQPFRLTLVPLAFLVLQVACGCERPSIVEERPPNFIASVEDGIALEMVDASFYVDGKLRSNRINLSTGRFAFLFVFIKSKGLYIVSVGEMEGAVVAGKFMGSRLAFVAGGTRIQFDNTTGHLLGDGNDRDAWVEYLPDYDLLGPDARPEEAVVGLARTKSAIPGFAENP